LTSAWLQHREVGRLCWAVHWWFCSVEIRTCRAHQPISDSSFTRSSRLEDV